MRRFTTLGLLVILIFTYLLTGCSNNKQAAADSSQTIPSLTIGTTMKVEGINIEDYYFGILQAIFTHKGLVKLDENGDFIGDLAKSWSTADGQTWTFLLHDGVTWHDGFKVTAADVKFTIEYNIKHSVEYRSHFSLVKSITTPDDKTVIITLSQPNPRFLVNLLVLRTLPQHIFSSVETPATYNDPKAAIGCGPYKFEKLDTNAGIVTFKANTTYYRGTPPIPEIKVRLFKNSDALYMALQNGKVDLPYTYSAGTDPIYAANLAKNTRIKLMNISNFGVSKALLFNVTKPGINDPQVRTALSYAIDYNELVRLFAANNGSTPTAGFVPRGTPGFIETRPLEFNPDKARLLLDQAGYRLTGSNIREKAGQPLSFELLIRNDIPENIRLAELLQKYFANIGVKLTLKTVDATLYRTICDKDKSYTSLLSRTTPWGMMMWAGMGTGYIDSRNIGWSMVSDAKFKDLVDNMNSTLDLEVYKKHSADLQHYYAENLPAIPLYWDSFIQPYNATMTGWKVSPMYGILNEETWYNLQKIVP
ncbi:Nickel-binding periplasmic protein precursor [Sporomusa ovata DSM 2662]|uniref:Oligopeptide ABC transporter, periplasmic oligopeptide-binding protein OppA (TC 3.A.1.5.1) n=1 Tax=Sporomusa ovata TaxID=2378 RepID=A0A0U1KSF7_9FIRM|nr:ABC transporter substrate-binding protein [Sporomusa ovata]EQB24991.1 ABC-type dipeptide transport system, periplasmic component [Sporomusa ovata DSM 2662]CQR70195.1 Oligopeptide ABC transporter, periplasmic oligopeptide-binding protein OppA (TC 3.A.1.5.1) [Sporomusa ovata]